MSLHNSDILKASDFGCAPNHGQTLTKNEEDITSQTEKVRTTHHEMIPNPKSPVERGDKISYVGEYEVPSLKRDVAKTQDSEV